MAVPGSRMKSSSGSNHEPISRSTASGSRAFTSGPTVTTTLLSETCPVPSMAKAAFSDSLP